MKKLIQFSFLTLLILFSCHIFAETCPMTIQIKNHIVIVPKDYEFEPKSATTIKENISSANLIKTMIFLDNTLVCAYNANIILSKRLDDPIPRIQHNPHWKQMNDSYTCVVKTKNSIDYCQF